MLCASLCGCIIMSWIFTLKYVIGSGGVVHFLNCENTYSWRNGFDQFKFDLYVIFG